MLDEARESPVEKLEEVCCETIACDATVFDDDPNYQNDKHMSKLV